MPRRASRDTGDKLEDFQESALRAIEQTIGEPLIPKKNPHAVALARLGALKGALARAASLTKKRRSEIAKKAARARWGKK
jgi:hypothetical protein